jgi:hypothetical protein
VIVRRRYRTPSTGVLLGLMVFVEGAWLGVVAYWVFS